MLAWSTWLTVGVFVGAWVAAASIAAAHAIMYKRDSRSAAIWMILSWALPLAGPWLYWVFGVNRLERQAVRQRGHRGRDFVAPLCIDVPDWEQTAPEVVGHLAPLRRAAERVTRLPLLPGNAVEPLHAGEQAYPRMLAAIEHAEHSVTLASYIFDWDEVGHSFVAALEAAARRGVRVHVLVDGIGALGNGSRMGRLLLKSGAEVAAFFPLRFPFGRLRINLRNHRKILVVDGRVGFTGGMNISARHLLGTPSRPPLPPGGRGQGEGADAPAIVDCRLSIAPGGPDAVRGQPTDVTPLPPGGEGRVRGATFGASGLPASRRVEDLHFQLTGPVVAELQHTFVEDWALVTGEVLTGDAYFPPLAPGGPALCRGISSGPDEDFETIHWIMQAALGAARDSVRIATPYFVPTSALISAMVLAALRGVRITLLLPGLVDRPFMRWAADAYLWQLLEHGVHIRRRPPPFVHTKLMIVDDRWTLLGSANLDRRSFRLNFEFNVEAYDVQLAQQLGTWMDALAAASEPVTLEQMDSRPPWRRIRDGTVKLFSPYL
ncbi:MAG TPA: phospholipase D-like domain-containing protein [Phycisphaerae bacterium]|nr:phospholipase D-like domain-containing protein [Phycisphaerae bacterium]HNU44191.1 phospholipase D-like domain-containing protein [Phycisphaerae bacterium]